CIWPISGIWWVWNSYHQKSQRVKCMRKKKNNIPKMKDAISPTRLQSEMQVYKHFKKIGLMHKSWGGCDKTSSCGCFGAGGGS
ncbi:MAG: hypothetical protein SOV75_01725, partial [Candidatus Limiplasma sp.]|nr:hypothetical protein [Candidatus Limiplasma sp.]